MPDSLADITVENATATLLNDNAAFVDWCYAAFRLCCLPGGAFDDWLLCLSRSGLPAETGAIKLYTSTKRPQLDKVVVDQNDWQNYLRTHGFIA